MAYEPKTWDELRADQDAWRARVGKPSLAEYERRWAKLVIDHRPSQDWCFAIPAGNPGSPYQPGTDETIAGKIDACTLYEHAWEHGYDAAAETDERAP